MFDVTPKEPKCRMCCGEGYILEHMDTISMGGVNIIPYDPEVWVMCMYCMGTGDNDRRELENFKYADMGQRKIMSDGFGLPGEARQHHSIRQDKEMLENGTWNDWYGRVSRMEQYLWSPDFVKMKEYGKFIMICKEKV